MKRVAIALVVLGCLALSGCGVEEVANREFDYSPKRITHYSGGKEVGSWISKGKVFSENESDGWYFNDSKTGRSIIISGDVRIEQVAE